MPKTHVPTPSPQWINIKSTYANLTTKLKEKKFTDASGSQKDVTDEMRQAAIIYWIHRLAEDSASIADGAGPCDS